MTQRAPQVLKSGRPRTQENQQLLLNMQQTSEGDVDIEHGLLQRRDTDGLHEEDDGGDKKSNIR